MFIYLSFFSSGVAAIIYQLLWQRDLFRLFGVNIESVTVVITAFMLGLGTGGLFGSWLSSRKSSAPILIFAIMEATIAIFGIESLRIFAWMGTLLHDASLILRTLGTIAVLFVPTCCMGATLQLLVRDVVLKSSNVGASTGKLYYVNTVGAVVGCLLSGFWLFPFLGASASLETAACLNLFACICAGIAFWRSRQSLPQQVITTFEHTRTRNDRRPVSYRAALVLAGVSGFASLSYEIFFLHVAAFASGGNSLMFVVVLAAVLLGIASGARELGVTASANDSVPAKLYRDIAVAGPLGLILLPLMAQGRFLGSGISLFLPPFAFFIARALGGVFPLVSHLAVRPDDHAGPRVGLIYTMNIIGSTSGTLLTGFWLCQIFGLRDLSIFLCFILIFLSFLLFFLTKTSREIRIFPKKYFIYLMLVLVLVATEAPLTSRLFDSMLARTDPKFSGRVSDVVENRSGIIAVTDHGYVYGGGVYDGVFNIDPLHDVNGVIRPYALSLFHPAPRDVLMIGLASGSWAQIVASNPDVDHLTIVEINPGYLSLVKKTDIVKSLISNKKVKIIIDDGHRWLMSHNNSMFDAILANTTYHYRSNSSNLLSVEFYQLIKGHLKNGGIYLFNATGSIRAQRSGCSSFKYGFRVLNNLVLSDSPFGLDRAHWNKVIDSYRIDGVRMFPTTDGDAAARVRQFESLPDDASSTSIPPEKRRLESCESLMARVPALPLITDDNMGTEWRYPLLHEE